MFSHSACWSVYKSTPVCELI